MSRNSFRAKTLLIFLLICGIFSKYCDSETNTEDGHADPDEQGGDGSNAFFALRSCHQAMYDDSGEFFSPDYLCSNPPLWCNWTIHVDAEKRVHLYLEDLTPDDACHLKQDQIHVDEPAGSFVGHKVLQKCWHEAKYISTSNTLNVVLLIGGHPSTPYRGFYGRYQAFGPPIVYNPPNDSVQHDDKLWLDSITTEPSLSQKIFPEPIMDAQQIKRVLLEQPTETLPANHDQMYDYYDEPPPVFDELSWIVEDPKETNDEVTVPPAQEEEESVQVGRGHRQDPSPSGQLENDSNVSNFTAAPTTVMLVNQKTSRSGRGAAQDPLQHEGTTVHQQKEDSEPTPYISTAKRRTINEPLEDRTTTETIDNDPPQRLSEMGTSVEGPGLARGNKTVKRHNEVLNEDPSPPESILAHPSILEPLSDYRRNGNIKNRSDFPHLPGDSLFEVAVELNFQHDPEEPWDHTAKSLLMSVQTLIGKQLEALHTPKPMSLKRIKRLSAGVLYILWLQISGRPDDSQVHRVLHATLQSLIETAVSFGNNDRHAVIVSVSTADINECGTHLVVCDVNAECVNQFGTYSCHCRPGFQDVSRLGSGGVLCVDIEGSIGCDPGHFPELTKGVYVLFFLLSGLVLMLLLLVGVVYLCRRRGSFLVPCCNSSLANRYCDSVHDGNNDHGSFPANSELPPPPPPIRRPREGWSHPKDCCPSVDLPLLRFSPILPLDAYKEPEEVGKCDL